MYNLIIGKNICHSRLKILACSSTSVSLRRIQSQHHRETTGTCDKRCCFLSKTLESCFNGIAQLTNIQLPPAPNGVKLFRSSEESVGTALPRDFIDFALTDDSSLDLRQYLRLVQAAEDYFYQTVNQLSNPAPPGQVTAHSVTPPIIYMYRDKNDTCVLGNYLNFDRCTAQVKQLHRVLTFSDKKQHFFYHKYLLSHGGVVIGCVEEKLKWKNKREFSADCGRYFYQ